MLDHHAPQAFSPLTLDNNPTNICKHLFFVFSSKGYNRHSVPGQMTLHSEVYQIFVQVALEHCSVSVAFERNSSKI